MYTIFQMVFSLLCYFFIYVNTSYFNYILTLRIHLVIEYFIVSIFFLRLFESKSTKLILILLLPIFLSYNIYDYLSYSNLIFSNNPTLLEFLIFIIFIILFLFEKMQINQENPIYSSISFWVCVGLFVYFTGNFFYILLVQNSANADISIKNQLKLIYCVITISKNLILSFALMKNEIEHSINKYTFQIPKDLNFDSLSPNNNIN